MSNVLARQSATFCRSVCVTKWGLAVVSRSTLARAQSDIGGVGVRFNFTQWREVLFLDKIASPFGRGVKNMNVLDGEGKPTPRTISTDTDAPNVVGDGYSISRNEMRPPENDRPAAVCDFLPLRLCDEMQTGDILSHTSRTHAIGHRDVIFRLFCSRYVWLFPNIVGAIAYSLREMRWSSENQRNNIIFNYLFASHAST